MTLQETIERLDQFDRAWTIYAVYPWQPSSSAIVARSRDDGGVPDEAITAGCRYFLEVFIALHLVREFSSMRGRAAGDTELCARLIEYAEFVSSEGTPSFLKWTFPVNMMISCRGCGKLFDITVTGEGSKDYCCPACGRVQPFDLDAFAKKAIEQTRKMRKKPHAGR